MNLENFKNIFLNGRNILRFLMAAVFISAGIFRVFNPQIAANELINLNIPSFFSWGIIILEVGGGLILLFGGRFLKHTIFIFVSFLFFALFWSLRIHGVDIIYNSGELFVFKANPVDFFLHFVFIIILVALLYLDNKK